MTRQNLINLFLIFFCCFASSACLANGKLTAILHTRHFEVHYNPDDPYLARIFAQRAETEFRRISRSLGYNMESRRLISLYVYPTHAGFIKAGGLEDREWTVGTAASESERIAIDASSTIALPAKILAHEITHIVIFRILGKYSFELPLWMNEGLAILMSDDFTAEQAHFISEAAAEGRLLPLKVLEKRFPENSVDLSYAQSASAVRYMISKYGKESPRRVLHELAKTGSFDSAMKAAAGLDGNQFANEWYSQIASKYWLPRLTRIFMQFLAVIMAILAIVAFLVRRRQKIEAARRWELEEFEEALRKQRGNDWHSPIS